MKAGLQIQASHIQHHALSAPFKRGHEQLSPSPGGKEPEEVESEDVLLLANSPVSISTPTQLEGVSLPAPRGAHTAPTPAPGAGGSRHTLTLLPFRCLGLAALTTFAGVVCSAKGGEERSVNTQLRAVEAGRGKASHLPLQHRRAPNRKANSKKSFRRARQDEGKAHSTKPCYRGSGRAHQPKLPLLLHPGGRFPEQKGP